jgi:hypothetical protein
VSLLTRIESLLALGIAALSVLAHPAGAATCESLTQLQLPHAKVVSSQPVTGGSFDPPGSGFAPPGAPQGLSGLPPLCRVVVQSTPTADSLINIEIWIPLGDAWNGKYEQLGCGGFCGTLQFGYFSLARAVRRGYASAITDDGNQSAGDGNFALGHPEKVIDFGYRALKETTDSAKAVIAALANHGPARSYFNGCSDGGREALMEAQRFPDDFDGIIVGAPANAWTHLVTGMAANEQALLADPASYLDSARLSVLSKAALARCGMHDGNAPGDAFINDPLRCKFDPAAVQCKSGQDPKSCLTPAQVRAAKSIYGGPHDPYTGKQIAPGFAPGNEDDPGNWPMWITGASREADLRDAYLPATLPIPTTRGALQQFYANSFFGNFVYQNPRFDFRTVDVVTAARAAESSAGKMLDSVDPDLTPFMRHGGKIIHYHGWDDSALAPKNSIEYYEQVRATLGKATHERRTARSYRQLQESYRLFMVPGMGHCAGGPGANELGAYIDPPTVDADHDLLKALERWVEQDIAPDKIIATHYQDGNPAKGVQFQRPLCPFPQTAHYDGRGDPTDAKSFSCH